MSLPMTANRLAQILDLLDEIHYRHIGDEIRAEIHRLRDERDAARAELGDLHEANDGLGRALVETRAELAKAREALTELATINPGAKAAAENRRREAGAQTVVYGISVNEWDRLWELVEEIHRRTAPSAVETPTPGRVSTVALLGLAEAAASVALDGDTFAVDQPAGSGVVACGPDETREDQGGEAN